MYLAIGETDGDTSHHTYAQIHTYIQLPVSASCLHVWDMQRGCRYITPLVKCALLLPVEQNGLNSLVVRTVLILEDCKIAASLCIHLLSISLLLYI